jgi:hypothetical protein
MPPCSSCAQAAATSLRSAARSPEGGEQMKEQAFWTPPSRKRCRDSSVNPFVNKLRPRDEGGRGASMEENSDSLA